ncbi:MAG TPA: MaoC family dehydratase [Rubrivivax sp.]|nr:MaoC family dehydratase [Rubrivivax sp.]
MATTFDSNAAVLAAVGRDLGATDWMVLDQARIQRFADATDDQQWIHVDPQRAAAGPFGGCIAHGYLTLALASKFLPELVSYQRLKMGVNVGTDRVRFPAPVKAGSRIRGRGEVLAAEEAKGGAVKVTIRITVEIEGSDKPGCVVDTISLLTFE